MTATITETPRIYVASLSDYNSGRLVGAWVDATDADEIYDAIRAMLSTSREPIAEEWAIHDYENFGKMRLSEYESIDRVASIGAAILEHGDAFAAWVSNDSTRADNLEGFRDQYIGEYESAEDYAQEWAESAGYLDAMPDALRYHIDWESFANDLMMDLETHDAPGGGIYVFDPSA